MKPLFIYHDQEGCSVIGYDNAFYECCILDGHREIIDV